MILFYDTETTGKWHFDLPVDHDAQPDLVQLAAVLCDEEGKELSKLSCIIRPDGWLVQAEAAAIHGISDYRARSTGVPLVSALALFSALCSVSNKVVGHNLAFDWNIMERSYWRINRAHRLPQTMTCTMLTLTPVLKLPKPNGRSSAKDPYKWVGLQESYMHAFGKKFEGAHDALADVEATMAIYFWAKERGVAEVPPKIKFYPPTKTKGATENERSFAMLKRTMDAVPFSRLGDWEQGFVTKMRGQIEQYGEQVMLSNRQWPIVEKLYGRYVKGDNNVSASDSGTAGDR